MKTKNYDTERALVLKMIEEVNDEEEYNYLRRELAELENPALGLCGCGISAWIEAYEEPAMSCDICAAHSEPMYLAARVEAEERAAVFLCEYCNEMLFADSQSQDSADLEQVCAGKLGRTPWQN